MQTNDERLYSDLRQNGVATADHRSLTDVQMHEVKRYFSDKLVYNGHVRAKSNGMPITQRNVVDRREWPMFSCDMQDTVLAPYLFETVLSFYDVAKAYFDGEQPRLYSMNTFWTQKVDNGAQYQDTHGWHRDGDDRKQLVVFILGSDVLTPSQGPHVYQIGTHVIPDDKLGRDFRSPPPHVVRNFGGLAGTVFLSDTRGLHMGMRPMHNEPRMLAWGRFGVSNPPDSYHWDQLKPVDKAFLGDRYPQDHEIQEAIRLVVS